MMAGWIGRLAALLRTSRIGLRLLAFNLLVVFLPVAGILYLDVYERELLRSQERGMIAQARTVAAALSIDEPLDLTAPLLIARLPHGDMRIRVHAAAGGGITDSAALVRAPTPTAPSRYDSPDEGDRTSTLYRVGAWLARLRTIGARWVGRIRGGEQPVIPVPGTQGLPPEVATALGGRYGSATRPTPGQRSLTLYSAVPVLVAGEIAGVVVVSQSTYRILQALYHVRLRIFQVVVASVVVAALLSAVLSATVVRPLVRLRRAASALSERRGALPARFRGSERADEIGDLARALEELTLRLDAHIGLLEAFSADVSHEFKNPLASIRTAAEMIATSEASADRQRFLSMLTRDVDRLERLVSGVRELAHIDAQLAQEPVATTDLSALIAGVVEGVRLTDGAALDLRTDTGRPALTRGSPDRLAQVFENIIRNARSFAPADTVIDVGVRLADDQWCVSIADRGPGIPAAHLDRVFDRFFTYRPGGSASREHSGLGLAIARAIVTGYGGSISAANRDGGGAVFDVRLPRVRSRAGAFASEYQRHPAGSRSFKA